MRRVRSARKKLATAQAAERQLMKMPPRLRAKVLRIHYALMGERRGARNKGTSAVAIVALLLFALPVHAEPKHHFWHSKKFWTAFAIDSAAMVADYGESQAAFARGAHETNPIFGSRRPSFARMSVIGIPFTFAYSYTSWRMSESRHRVLRDAWLLPVTYDVGNHAYLAFGNTQLKGAQ